MKKIVDYRKLLGVDKTTNLKDMKNCYRSLMKEWHPDKFVNEDDKKLAAEEKSKELIEAYNFLLSIAPETMEQNLPEYTQSIGSNVLDFDYKAKTLQVFFSDGSSYEYYDVPSNIFNKLCNSDVPGRFIRRNVCNAFVYRKVTNPTTV